MMKNKYLLILLVTLSANCLQAKIIEKSVVVNFETDKHELTAEHVVSIQAFINSISFSGDYELMIKNNFIENIKLIIFFYKKIIYIQFT